jgi:flagellar hook-associated protein 2
VGISSPGIGSGLDVNTIVSKLMAVESAPLTDFDKKTASFQAQVSAFGAMSSALGNFQSTLTSLSSIASFQALTTTPGDATVVTATTTSSAQAGNYRVNISQLAQAQTLASGGYKSSTATLGTGAKTTISFALGTVSNSEFGIAGTALANSMRTSGLTAGSVSINGTTITTNNTTRSARALADAINDKTTTTGVSAKASPALTDKALFSTFGDIDTSTGGSYTLSVGGVDIAVQGANVAGGAGVTAASLDAALSGDTAISRALADANITVTGTAAGGDLQFSNADGSNVALTETVTGNVTGGIGNTAGTANIGSSVTAVGTITLLSADGSPITVGGSNPAAAGLTAGVGGNYLSADFSADSTRTAGNIVIDSTNNTLQGIMDAINKGNFGVTASIVSDGSTGTGATPNHLVLTSSSTGANSTMKITLAGSGGDPADPDLVKLLGYDPGGDQNLSQKAAAADTLATVNGIAVTSSGTSITGAVTGVTFNALKIGSTSVTVAKDSSTLTNSVNSFVKAYNDLNTQLAALGSYDPDTKAAGPLLGDSTLRNLSSSVRATLSSAIAGLQSTSLTSLSQIGVSFQKDGSLAVENAKLQKAITNNFNDIAGLFAAVGRSSDPDITFSSSSTKTQAGSYGINITQLATQGTLQGNVPLPAETTIDQDTTWTVTLDDTTPPTLANTATITLPAGTYNPSQLATLLQSSINGVSAFSNAGAAVTATLGDDGSLKLQSASYGAASNLKITTATGTDVSAVFGTGSAVDGLDVVGTIGGYSATGKGQVLTGSPGGPVDGLKLTVKGDTLGARGTFGFSQGYAYMLNTLAAGYLGSSGTIASRTKGLNASVTDIATQRASFADRLTDIEKRYRTQYSALDTTIASMNSTQQFLTQQLAQLAANS